MKYEFEALMRDQSDISWEGRHPAGTKRLIFNQLPAGCRRSQGESFSGRLYIHNS
ncbi:MAG: hypothetical protein HY774_26310 [Acidobacteria bacterium]|nr:hypothetical protein [Acidobacteriota bacterium]